MTNKKKKELESVLNIFLPDEYYEEMRKGLLPYVIRWHENEIKELKESMKKKKCKHKNFSRVGGAVDLYRCDACGVII
jgi:hypothetical protein